MFFKSSLFLLIIASAVKLVAVYYTKFNLFGDEAQYWIWSQTLDVGYYSKPPFLAWVIKLFTTFLGNGFVSLKLIPFVIYFLSTYVVYLLTLELYKKNDLAIITAISFYLLPAVTLSSFLLSTDVILILLWSICLICLLKIRKDPNLVNFFILGVLLGLSFLTKYAAIYFLLSLVFLLIIDKQTREVFISNFFGCICFVSSALIVFFPNIIWNINNNWVTLEHTSDNIGINRLNFHFYGSLEFIFSQLMMVGPILSVFFLIYIKKIKLNFQTKFLLCFSLPIFFVVLLESFLVRANANWAAVAIVSIFVLMINLAYNCSRKIIVASNFANFVFCIIFFLLVATSYPVSVFDRISGIGLFATKLISKHLKDYDYIVVEDRLFYSSLSYELRNFDVTLLTPYNPKEKVKSHFQISNPLLPEFKNNFIYIGNPDALSYLKQKNKIKKVSESKVKFKKNIIKIYEVFY